MSLDKDQRIMALRSALEAITRYTQTGTSAYKIANKALKADAEKEIKL